MAKLKDKIEGTFDEALILITAAEVVLGFQFKSVFETGFASLPATSQLLKVGGLGLLLTCLCVLMAPAAYHHLVEQGEDSEGLYRFTTLALALALVPFALALGIDTYVTVGKVAGLAPGVAAGLLILLIALGLWYALAFFDRRRGIDQAERRTMTPSAQAHDAPGADKLKDKIKQVLQEARMVIPGAQALLGFQFVVVLSEGFDKLPEELKYVHLLSLGLIALSVILLMTPATYHRIVEQGEETEHFYSVASRFVVAAMVPLALGMAGDFYVVVSKVVQSPAAALAAALATLGLFYGLWFGYTLYERAHKRSRSRAAQQMTRQHEQSNI